MKPKHTPGPWELEFDNTPAIKRIKGPSFKIQYVWLATGITEEMHRQRDADANLIAAAPELMALAIAVFDHFSDTNSPLREQALLAIKKATIA